MNLWVARHARVAVEGRCYGRSDVAVREPHDRSAALLAKTFAGAAPAFVWSSPMSRCRGVAEHLAVTFGATLKIDEALHELDFGRWEGRAWSEIAREAAYDEWARDWERVGPPGGERPRDIERRVRGWLASLDTSRVHALVAHAGVVRALRVVVERRTWPDAMQLAVEHLVWSHFAIDAHDHAPAVS